MSNHVQKIAVLYSELSGYTIACLKALKETYDIKLLVFRWPLADNAPFDASEFDFIDELYIRRNQSAEELISILRNFSPQALLIAGWMDKGYLKVAMTYKKKGIPVIAGADTQWNGSLRQRLACLVAPWHLHNAIDVLWVTGERQRQFARKLGFRGSKCWSGMYACDWDRFAKVTKTRSNTDLPFFLFVGRYIDVKGIDLLVQAYSHYRNTVQNPWKLVCAGTGPKQVLLHGQEGIEDIGFIQPDGLPELMGEASAFILPSRKEPWGVVVHEAAASGLPIICSEASGASVHLVQDGYNGFIVENENWEHLAEKMIQLHSLSAKQRSVMSERGHELSKQFTPKIWATTLIMGLTLLHSNQNPANS